MSRPTMAEAVRSVARAEQTDGLAAVRRIERVAEDAGGVRNDGPASTTWTFDADGSKLHLEARFIVEAGKRT